MNTLSTINNPLGAPRGRAGGDEGWSVFGDHGRRAWRGLTLRLFPQSTFQNNVIFFLKIHICHCKFTPRLIK